MIWPILSIGLLVTAQVDTTAVEPPPEQTHPRFFLTASDVTRARQAVGTNEQFARRVEDLTTRAKSANVAELPSLDRDWWESSREKPWAETYQQVFRHTWLNPYDWADLARTCAYANLLQPSPELAEKAKATLLSLSNYTFEFEHYDVGMNYTVWGIVALEACDILHDSFDERQRQRLDAFFERFYEAVKKNDDYWIEHEPGGKLNNHYAWHKLCFVATGLFFDHPERIDSAFEGPKGIDFLMRHGFTDDGLWREGAIPYQFAATSPLVKTAELLDNAGHARSLYDGTGTGGGRDLRLAHDALLNLLFPDRRLPTIGDCYAARRHLGAYTDFEVLWRRFADPHYAWLLRDADNRSQSALIQGPAELPQGVPPEQHSRLWPEAGYVALRSVEGADYWSGRGWTLFGTYSANSVHSNADKLSIQLFGAGHLWLPDLEARSSEVHAFSSSVQAQLNRHTVCHNTLLVDRQGQRHPRKRLDLIEYHVLPSAKRVTMGDLDEQLYAGVRQLRTCIVRDQYVLDVFQVAADKPRQLVWLVHVDGISTGSSAGPSAPADLPDSGAWSYLVLPRTAGVADRSWETFRHDERHFRMDLLTSAPAELVQCGFPRDDGADPESVPMRMFRIDATEGWFAAVYQCGPEPPQAAQISLAPAELGNWTATVEINGRRFDHCVPQLAELD